MARLGQDTSKIRKREIAARGPTLFCDKENIPPLFGGPCSAFTCASTNELSDPVSLQSKNCVQVLKAYRALQELGE